MTPEITDLQTSFGDLMVQIVNARKKVDLFLTDNPQHTMRAEVFLELQQQIKILSQEADVTIQLIDVLEGME